MASQNRYGRLIEKIFLSHYKKGAKEISFKREEMIAQASRLKIALPKNLGDVIYSFRYRTALPEAIQRRAPEGKVWLIKAAGRGLYKFVAVKDVPLTPNPLLSETKILDATPGIVARYAMSDEQGLLAKIRYNRLIDIFTGVTSYSLQNHLRTTVPDVGQIETDELYIGVDSKGAHHIFPVQAKGGTDKLSMVQIEQDYSLCSHKFPGLICKPIAVQFIDQSLIALFSFEESLEGLKVGSEKHYRLVAKQDLTDEELNSYKLRIE